MRHKHRSIFNYLSNAEGFESPTEAPFLDYIESPNNFGPSLPPEKASEIYPSWLLKRLEQLLKSFDRHKFADI